MEITSLTLLDRLRETPENQDWERFVSIYRPFIHRYIRLDPILAADSDDICQEVMAKIVVHLPKFQRQRDGSFRAWLRTITVHEVSYYWRKRGRGPRAKEGHSILEGLRDPTNPLSQQWEREHASHVLTRLQELIARDFAPQTWQAFRLRVLEEKSTKEVSQLLGISEASVDVAKSRVLARLRHEAAGFLED